MPAANTATFPLDNRQISLGRDPSSAIVVQGVGVSRLHAFLRLDAGKPVLIDNESSFGTRVNGRPILSHNLETGDSISIGVNEFRVDISDSTITLARRTDALPAPALAQIGPPSGAVRIGRDPGNEICIAHPLVSRFHAEVRTQPNGGMLLSDTGSTNGVFVNGRPVRHANLTEGDIIQIGPQRLAYAAGRLAPADDCSRIKLDAMNVCACAGARVILHDISLSINPGEFAAILGPSGAGKTTLARVLTGRIAASGGAIFYNGLPLKTFFSGFSSQIGFVSQENVLHRELSVLETFREQALLRLPRDSIAAERGDRIDQVLSMLDIAHLRTRRIHDLSGGEAKRVHLGTELLSSPAIIFLDEPLAGLDTGLIRRFMDLFHDISRRGHTLLLTTHALEQIERCDRILFVNNGRLLYDGRPDATAHAFGVGSLAQVYEQVRNLPDAGGHGGRASARAPRSAHAPRHTGAVAPHPGRLFRPRSASFIRQLGVLLVRYYRMLHRDRKNLLLIFAQAPLIAGLLALVFKPAGGYLPLSFYFCISIAAIWCGGMNSVRELAREWTSFDREYRAGVSITAWLIAKLLVFGALAVVQAAVFWALYAALFRQFHLSADALTLLCAGSVAGSVMGLLISAFSGNVNRAISLLPIIFIPQIFFSGILIPFDRMPRAGEWLSRLTVARPVFSLFKRTCVLNETLWDKTEWQWLFAVCAGSIILMFAAVRRHCSARA